MYYTSSLFLCTRITLLHLFDYSYILSLDNYIIYIYYTFVLPYSVLGLFTLFMGEVEMRNLIRNRIAAISVLLLVMLPQIAMANSLSWHDRLHAFVSQCPWLTAIVLWLHSLFGWG